MKKVCELKSAWLITWEFHSQESEKELLKIGIKNKVINIVSPYKSFDYVLDYVKDIYRMLNASYSEKVRLIKRGKKGITKKDYFYSHPILTSYKTSLYKKLMDSLNDKGINSKEFENLSEKWKTYPSHISIGHNPSILALKVKNVVIYKEGFIEKIEWYDPIGKRKLSVTI